MPPPTAKQRPESPNTTVHHQRAYASRARNENEESRGKSLTRHESQGTNRSVLVGHLGERGQRQRLRTPAPQATVLHETEVVEPPGKQEKKTKAVGREHASTRARTHVVVVDGSESEGHDRSETKSMATQGGQAKARGRWNTKTIKHTHTQKKKIT